MSSDNYAKARRTLELSRAAAAGAGATTAVVAMEQAIDTYDDLVAEVDKLTRALDAGRWAPGEDCWCDVKATDQPRLHMPRCRKVRSILGLDDLDGA